MSTISLHPISRKNYDLVKHIHVEGDQALFAGTVKQAFEANEPEVDFHVIYADDCPIGFFKIDRGFGTNNDFAVDGELGLRAYKIDSQHQGKGYGTRAVRALKPYLQRQYPDAVSVVLTVSILNPSAFACYRKGGFSDTGDLFSVGIPTPQNIMRMALK